MIPQAHRQTSENPPATASGPDEELERPALASVLTELSQLGQQARKRGAAIVPVSQPEVDVLRSWLDTEMDAADRQQQLHARRQADEVADIRRRRIEKQAAVRGWLRIAAEALAVVALVVVLASVLLGQMELSGLAPYLRYVPWG